MPHGVTITETSTKVFAIPESPSAIPFIVGTAPKGTTNEIEEFGSFQEAANVFGQRRQQDDPYDWTLLRFFELFFQTYGVQPAFAVNVVDPSSDTASVTAESQTFSDNTLRTDNAHISNVTVTGTGGSPSYSQGSDYEVDLDKGLFTRVDGGGINAGDTIEIDYDYVDPTVAAASDIVGGVGGSGQRTGLELVEEVLPTFGETVNLILAPGFSQEQSVASAIESKAEGYSGGFQAFGLIDIDSSDSNYDEVSEAVSEKGNLTTSPNAAVFWPRVTAGDITDFLSAHAAGVIAETDQGRGGGLPYVSPSNKSLNVDGTEVVVTRNEAQTLSDNGLVTAFRRGAGSGFALWNNNTATFPTTTDVKDRFISTSRMATHLGNVLKEAVFQKVDEPTNRRLIAAVVSSVNQLLNGWEAEGALVGNARVAFLEGDNSTQALLNGEITFRVFYAAPTPAQDIEMKLTVDVDQYDALFA